MALFGHRPTLFWPVGYTLTVSPNVDGPFVRVDDVHSPLVWTEPGNWFWSVVKD